MKIPKGNHKTRIPTQTSSQLQQYIQRFRNDYKKRKKKINDKKTQHNPQGEHNNTKCTTITTINQKK